jgi:hypothetical protein
MGKLAKIKTKKTIQALKILLTLLKMKQNAKTA